MSAFVTRRTVPVVILEGNRMSNELSKGRLVDESITEFMAKLGSGDPTPGGGAAAALSSAMGASLLMMVANHTIGKAKYAADEPLNIKVRDEAEVLRGRFLEGVDKDAEAFLKVSAAFGMGRSFSDIQIDRVSAVIEELRAKGYHVDDIDEDEGLTAEIMDQIEDGLKAARSAAIGEASVEAAEAPLAVMRDSVAALRLAASLPGHSNPNLLSDVLVAAHCFQSGLISAGYNVSANIPAIKKRDTALADKIKKESTDLLNDGAMLADSILHAE